MCLALIIPKISRFWATTTGGYKILLRRLTTILRIDVSKTKVMSPLIPGEQRQTALLDGEPLEGVDKFKHLSSMFI